jgi:bacteriorhodopsin
MMDVSFAQLFSANALPPNLLAILPPYLYWLGFIGFAGASLYFVLERGNLAPEFRVIASLNAVVALVSAISYYYLSGLGGTKLPIPQSLAQGAVQLHHLDWLITLPLLLLQIPVLLGMDRSSRWLVVRLVLSAVVLVAVGISGEWLLSKDATTPLSVDTAFTLYGIAVVALLLLLFTLYVSLADNLAEQPVEVVRAFNQMRLLILLGYSLSFIIPLTALFVEFGALRDALYSLSDWVNKLAFGVVSMSAALSLSYEWVDEDDGWTEVVVQE